MSTPSEPITASAMVWWACASGSTGNEQDRADGEDHEMGGGELALGELGIGAVDEPEQHHRGEADQIDMRVHGRELEMLAHSHPDAEGKAENPAEQPDQNDAVRNLVNA